MFWWIWFILSLLNFCWLRFFFQPKITLDVEHDELQWVLRHGESFQERHGARRVVRRHIHQRSVDQRFGHDLAQPPLPVPVPRTVLTRSAADHPCARCSLNCLPPVGSSNRLAAIDSADCRASVQRYWTVPRGWCFCGVIIRQRWPSSSNWSSCLWSEDRRNSTR